jgi:ABC-type lipoprotein release transport system permease subunit
MSLLLTLAARNTLRNTRRTALTAATVLFGTGLLTFGLSWIHGVEAGMVRDIARSVGHVRVVSSRWLEREKLAPLYENLPQTSALVAAAAEVPGVVSVWPRISLGVMASKDGEELGEVFGMVVGAPLDYFEQSMELRPRIAEGAWFTGEGEGEALIGKTLANQMGVGPGDRAIFLGTTQDGSISPLAVRVVGLIDSGTGAFDRQVYVPLATARWMADIPEGALELLIITEDPLQAGAVARAVEARLAGLPAGLPEGATLRAQSWGEREPFASMFGTMGAVLSGVAGVIVFITALGVLNTMLMSVLERTAEIGVLRALGMKGRAIVALFFVEALAIGAVGGAVGVFLGSLAALRLEAVGMDLGAAADKMPATLPVNRVLHADWTPEIALLAFALGLLMALLGAALPSLRATAIQPVIAMRSRR